ncbi:MAG: GNAT family N-acetyltransferase [Rhodomicrobium sp.]
MHPFELTTYNLGPLTLRPLTTGNAAALGEAMAFMPPWSVIGWPAERLVRSLQGELPSVCRFEVKVDEALAGVVTIQAPFLHGPYLQLLAILPEFQGRKLGQHILVWMEAQARLQESRQLWLCVSTFNTRGRAFYERFGFEEVAALEKLASDVSDELLMRKRLSYGAAAPDAIALPERSGLEPCPQESAAQAPVHPSTNGSG